MRLCEGRQIKTESRLTMEAADAHFERVTKKLNVFLATIGSLGDLHPFAALGLALKGRGHRVHLVTTGNYESFAHDLGLEFIELASAETYRRNTLNPNVRKRSRSY